MRFLMCPPDAYDVSYVINPWMEGNVKKSSPQAAMGQWLELTRILKERAEIELIPPQPGLPDLVFTANAGLVLGNVVILSRFLHPERQGEEPHRADRARHGAGRSARQYPGPRPPRLRD